MFTEKHVTVSTRVLKVVRHSHKEWFLNSRVCGQFLREKREMEIRLWPNLNNIYSCDDGGDVIMQLSQGRTLINMRSFRIKE